MTDIHIIGDIDRRELLQLTASAERISEHHLGQTIVKYAHQQGLECSCCTERCGSHQRPRIESDS